MDATDKISDTSNAWDDGELGRDVEFVAVAPVEDEARINEALGLRPISIRLEQSLIDDFKALGAINGLGYQTLMRQVLKRFADSEKKRILVEAADRIIQRREGTKDQSTRKLA